MCDMNKNVCANLVYLLSVLLPCATFSFKTSKIVILLTHALLYFLGFPNSADRSAAFSTALMSVVRRPPFSNSCMP